MRCLAILPLLCSITAFVLSILCLLAGSKPGFMEEYNIVTLNTSTLGHAVLFPITPTSSSPTTIPSSWLTGIVQNISSAVNNFTSTIEGDLQGLQNNIADNLAKELGIQQFYSLHMMDMCEGMFSPNATAPGAGYNVSKCTKQTAMYNFDPTAQIQSELSANGLNLNLATFHWPDDIQTGIDALNAIFAATFVLYCIGITAAGLTIIFAFIAFFMRASRLISLGNLALTSLSFLCLAIASIIITVFISKISDLLNENGNEIGLYAYKGGKYLALTWSATSVMLLASFAWIVEGCLARNKRRREFTEKAPEKRGWRALF